MDRSADIRLVAIDLDGTLLNDAKQVSEQTVGALVCLPPKGIKVVIASARPPRSVRAVYQTLRLDTWQINYNGAMVWDERERGAVFHQPMDCGLVRRMIGLARGHAPEVLVSCEIKDRWCTDNVDQHLESRHLTETARLFRPDFIGPVDAFCVEPISKLLLLGDPELIKVLKGMLMEAHGREISIIDSDPDLLQISHRAANKAAALRVVAGHYSVPMSDVMAIGDATNDVPMLEAAGVAVAMDNAHPLAKAAADWVAPSNNDHGVHAALKRYGLCE